MTESSATTAKRETTSVRSNARWHAANLVGANVIQTSVRAEYLEWYELCEGGRAREAGARVAERIDRHLRHGDFHAVDTLFEMLDPARLAPSIVVGLVAWTKPAAEHLRKRDVFVERAHARLAAELGVERAATLLAPAR